jgi:hypothetical protein
MRLGSSNAAASAAPKSSVNTSSQAAGVSFRFAIVFPLQFANDDP